MSEAYKEGWADYRRTLYLRIEEAQWLLDAAYSRGTEYYDEWMKGWNDAAEADTTLMD
jgi:hypothetical protein